MLILIRVIMIRMTASNLCGWKILVRLTLILKTSFFEVFDGAFLPWALLQTLKLFSHCAKAFILLSCSHHFCNWQTVTLWLKSPLTFRRLREATTFAFSQRLMDYMHQTEISIQLLCITLFCLVSERVNLVCPLGAGPHSHWLFYEANSKTSPTWHLSSAWCNCNSSKLMQNGWQRRRWQTLTQRSYHWRAIITQGFPKQVQITSKPYSELVVTSLCFWVGQHLITLATLLSYCF